MGNASRPRPQSQHVRTGTRCSENCALRSPPCPLQNSAWRRVPDVYPSSAEHPAALRSDSASAAADLPHHLDSSVHAFFCFLHLPPMRRTLAASLSLELSLYFTFFCSGVCIAPWGHTACQATCKSQMRTSFAWLAQRRVFVFLACTCDRMRKASAAACM